MHEPGCARAWRASASPPIGAWGKQAPPGLPETANDRVAKMHAFAAAALQLFAEAVA